MRKTITYVFLVLILFGMLTACDKKTEEGGYVVQAYFISNEETKVEMHTRSLHSDTLEGQMQELISCLSENPEKLEYKAPLSLGFTVLDVTLEDGKLLLNVDSAYKQLSVTTEVLVRAALTRTLTQLDGISYVGINVDGSQLYDSLGSPVGWMSAEQFIDNDGSEINTYELARIKLYFAGESGTKLIAAYREKYYSSSTPLERFVVEELIAGPSGQVPDLYPTINPATKIINILTKDGICYVNLDAGFLTGLNNVSMECAVYSIVNSLVELNNINKVQILINGEVPSIFETSTYERNLDIVTTLEN
ncbi:MAG: GerMN domain-containing protein [Acetatifactor sp.]